VNTQQSVSMADDRVLDLLEPPASLARGTSKSRANQATFSRPRECAFAGQLLGHVPEQPPDRHRLPSHVGAEQLDVAVLQR
jgi:hypothetical protein